MGPDPGECEGGRRLGVSGHDVDTVEDRPEHAGRDPSTQRLRPDPDGGDARPGAEAPTAAPDDPAGSQAAAVLEDAAGPDDHPVDTVEMPQAPRPQGMASTPGWS
ncbi:MAG: hypothetical protein R2695_03375 [Acidimicrobiales bacterium]